MKWLLERLFLYKKVEIKTKISKARVMRIMKMLASTRVSYYGRVSDDAFVISADNYRVIAGGHGHVSNSFAPVMRGKVTEENGVATVKGVITMSPLVYAFALIFELASLVSIVGFPIFHLVMHLAFFTPAKQMREKTEQTLIGS